MECSLGAGLVPGPWSWSPSWPRGPEVEARCRRPRPWCPRSGAPPGAGSGSTGLRSGSETGCWRRPFAGLKTRTLRFTLKSLYHGCEVFEATLGTMWHYSSIGFTLPQLEMAPERFSTINRGLDSFMCSCPKDSPGSEPVLVATGFSNWSPNQVKLLLTLVNKLQLLNPSGYRWSLPWQCST